MKPFSDTFYLHKIILWLFNKIIRQSIKSIENLLPNTQQRKISDIVDNKLHFSSLWNQLLSYLATYFKSSYDNSDCAICHNLMAHLCNSNRKYYG